MSITVPDGDTLRPTNETTLFHLDSKHDVVVKVVGADGAGLVGRVVSLTVSGEDTSGGHRHLRAQSLLANRTRGILTPGRTLSTNTNGEATFRYEAPQFGGVETLTASVPGAPVVSKSVVISEPGLVPVDTLGNHYFVEPTMNHHPDDHFAFKGVIDTLAKIFDTWFERRSRRPRRYPFSEFVGHGARFKIDALALPYGGRFDIYGTWTGAHREHRSGLEVDVNDEAVERMEPLTRTMRHLCAEFFFGGRPVQCNLEFPDIPESRHFHIRFSRPTQGALREMLTMRAGIGAALVGIAASTASGQVAGATRYDAATNSYFVTVLTPEGSREIRVVPANGVRGTVRVAVAPVQGGWQYEYRVAITTQSRQDLEQFEVPCARAVLARDFAGNSFTKLDGTEPVSSRATRYADRDVCVADGMLAGGDSLTMRFTASAAPGLAALHLIGAVPEPAWPSGSLSFVENERASAVIDSIGGITGGWYEVTMPAPVRPLAALATPAQTAGAIADDLSAACGSLALIAPAGVCNSLRAKLDAVRQSIERGNANAAKGQVSALLLELDAQRGEHVREPAYIVLHTLAGLLQSQLAR